MITQFFIFGAPLILLILTFLFRKRIAVFSGLLLKTILAIVIGGIGGIIWLQPLFKCSEGELGLECFIKVGMLIPIIIVVGTLFMFAILGSILKKPQQLQSEKPSRSSNLFSIFALLLSLIVGMILLNRLSYYKLPGFDATFYITFIVPLISVISTVLVFIVLKKVFEKIVKIIKSKT